MTGRINYGEDLISRVEILQRRSETALALRGADENGTVCAVSTNIWFWVAFHVGVFIALAVDLTTFKRRNRELSMRAAFLRSTIWIVLSLTFNLLVWKLKGDDAALDFLTGY